MQAVISRAHAVKPRLFLLYDAANVASGLKRLRCQLSPQMLFKMCESRFSGRIELARFYSGPPRTSSVRQIHDDAKSAGFEIVITSENSDGRMQNDLGLYSSKFDGVVLLSNDGKAFAEQLESLGRDFGKRIFVVAPAERVNKSLEVATAPFGASFALPEFNC